MAVDVGKQAAPPTGLSIVGPFSEPLESPGTGVEIEHVRLPAATAMASRDAHACPRDVRLSRGSAAATSPNGARRPMEARGGSDQPPPRRRDSRSAPSALRNRRL